MRLLRPQENGKLRLDFFDIVVVALSLLLTSHLYLPYKTTQFILFLSILSKIIQLSFKIRAEWFVRERYVFDELFYFKNRNFYSFNNLLTFYLKPFPCSSIFSNFILIIIIKVPIWFVSVYPKIFSEVYPFPKNNLILTPLPFAVFLWPKRFNFMYLVYQQF